MPVTRAEPHSVPRGWAGGQVRDAAEEATFLAFYGSRTSWFWKTQAAEPPGADDYLKTCAGRNACTSLSAHQLGTECIRAVQHY